jgi:hypoxanthine phosphoribosyltransferase
VSTLPHVLLDERELAERVDALARAIVAEHPEGLVLVGVLKGALIFTADLARAIGRVAPELPVLVDFLAISRYAPDSGRVRILRDLDVDVADRDVVVVEDLVDTGLTAAYLLGQLEVRRPRRVEVCTLLDRSARRIVPVEPRFVGEEIPPDAFVLGYGLHLGERYRNLPVVVQADRDSLTSDPEGCLALYARSSAGSQGAGSRGAGSGVGAGERDARVRDEDERRRP